MPALLLFFQVDIPVPSRGEVLVKVKSCSLSLVSQNVSIFHRTVNI